MIFRRHWPRSKNRRRRASSIFNFQNRYLRRTVPTAGWNGGSGPLPRAGLVYAVARDITERKQAEEIIASHQALLEQTVRATNSRACGIAVGDASLPRTRRRVSRRPDLRAHPARRPDEPNCSPSNSTSTRHFSGSDPPRCAAARRRQARNARTRSCSSRAPLTPAESGMSSVGMQPPAHGSSFGGFVGAAPARRGDRRDATMSGGTEPATRTTLRETSPDQRPNRCGRRCLRRLDARSPVQVRVERDGLGPVRCTASRGAQFDPAVIAAFEKLDHEELAGYVRPGPRKLTAVG